MEEGNLPIEVAREPEEQARLSQGNVSNSGMEAKRRKHITFAEATQSSDHSASQNSSTYKDVLSQPAPTLSHRQRLLWLQRRRTAGLWAQCDDCRRWRHLPQVLDAQQLPSKWRCSMNPDETVAKCSVPEASLRLHEEEDLVHAEYSAGSIVLARLAGWPWWPAMVDDEPDTEQYYWLDGFSDIPTHYNVVFFDASDATRAWIAPNQLKPYSATQQNLLKDKKYKKRLEVAITQAEDAGSLPLAQRLAKYSFIARYPGAIMPPKKISKRELKKFQNKLKRKYNIQFQEESGSSDDESCANFDKRKETTVIEKGNNVLMIGTPKTPRDRKSRVQSKKKIKESLMKEDFLNNQPAVSQVGCIKDSLLESETQYEETANENAEDKPKESAEIFKHPNSMAVQVGSTITSTVTDTAPDNDTSTTYVAGSSEGDSELLGELVNTMRNRAVSPSSDDFDF